MNGACLQEFRNALAALLAADAEQGFADLAPGWAALVEALTAAVAAAGSGGGADVRIQQQDAEAGSCVAEAGSGLLAGVQAAVEAVLLWGQTIAAATTAWQAPSKDGEAVFSVSSC